MDLIVLKQQQYLCIIYNAHVRYMCSKNNILESADLETHL